MKVVHEYVRLSASDLSNHLACKHLTQLDLAVARGNRPAPSWRSPDLWVLQERGAAHEAAYVQSLTDKGLSVVDLSKVDNDGDALEQTRKAMLGGAQVIVQATLADGRSFGRADILQRIDRSSSLGAWSYEVYDCKLAQETKAGTILQLSLYSELVGKIQGFLPEWMYVVTPAGGFEVEPYRVTDFAAYYRQVKRQLESVTTLETTLPPTYPEPTPHCTECRWWRECDQQWRTDDHLSLVAGITRLQRKQLYIWEATTVERLAKFPLPIPQAPEYGSKEGYVRVREQARVQVDGRSKGQPVHEVLELEEGQGFCRLPEPSLGDIFFDMEGDPFVSPSGREYLFGFVTEDASGEPVYECKWAFTPREEKDAFQWFVGVVMRRWASHPDMHVFHFGAYEPASLKRLMGRHATCEDDIDRMLRAGLFVDLHTLFKQAVRASVEEYSLKALEVIHDFQRTVPLLEARPAIRRLEHHLELEKPGDLHESIREVVRGYNADDCLSTRSLRQWLEQRRTELLQLGQQIPRPVLSPGEAPKAVDERQQRVAGLVEELTRDAPADPQLRTPSHAALRLLADLLDWHRREDKADWWEFFRLKEAPEEDLFAEKSAVAGLKFVQRISLDGKLPVDRYSFEMQDVDIRAGETVHTKEARFGTVVSVDLANRTIDIKKTGKTAEFHASAVFAFDQVNAKALAESLCRLGTWVKTRGVDSSGPYRAARDLLLRRPPRLIGGETLALPGEKTLDAAKRIVGSLDHSVLAIQGPPGAGKTYTGARMICELVRRGKKVGVAAVSHRVIRKLLEETLSAAKKERLTGLTCLQKVNEKSESALPEGLNETDKNAVALAALEKGEHQVVAGTAWLWSREEFFESVDVLFVDEAGQMSLANVLAVAQAAKNIVLLGDPQQLDQPRKGSHPDGAEVSALEHILAGAKTIAKEKGLFLENTWRLHPKIRDFTSEVFYESRLQSRAGLENQKIEGHPLLTHSGLWFAPINHDGNQNSSPEEVNKIANIVESLLKPGVRWIDDSGRSRPLALSDILIVAPYNAQVSDLGGRLKKALVGTVDKFQGQEAPVVIYSLTTSSPEDAPRGMEFLYSLNRLNVATSRARAAVVVVGNRRLLEPECRTPHQMRLANALCRYVELAEVLGQ